MNNQQFREQPKTEQANMLNQIDNFCADSDFGSLQNGGASEDNLSNDKSSNYDAKVSNYDAKVENYDAKNYDAKVSNDSEEPTDEASSNEGGLGKFKSAQALLEAYNNLQAEFTRKCQKLSEFEKEKSTENTLSDTQVEDGLSKFLLENADAKDYTDELKQKVKSAGEGNPFESAWAKIVLEKISAQNAQKASDPLITKYVLGDEELKSKVIELYMKDLYSKKPPILLNTQSGERATKLDPVAPTSLTEAKRLVEDMFS